MTARCIHYSHAPSASSHLMNFSHQSRGNASTFPLSVSSVFYVSPNCCTLNLDWRCSHFNFSYKAWVPWNDSGAHVHWQGATCFWLLQHFLQSTGMRKVLGSFCDVSSLALPPPPLYLPRTTFGWPLLTPLPLPHHLDVRHSFDRTSGRFCRLCPTIEHKDHFAKATAKVDNYICILRQYREGAMWRVSNFSVLHD